MAPVVSIISPCLNGSNYLEQAIMSVQAQTFLNWELLLIDDGSTDGSDAVADRCASNDPRIVPMRTSGRIGAGPARNVGISMARGRYIAFLDCDDWWHPRKLELQLAAMGRLGAAFCVSPYTVCKVDGRPIRVQEVALPLTRRRYLLKRCVIGCLTVLIDVNKLGPFRFPEHLRRAEDLVVWVELLSRCERLGYAATSTEAALAFYRVHAGGQSSGKLQHAQAHWRIYTRELGLPWSLAVLCFASYVINGVLNRLRPLA